MRDIHTNFQRSDAIFNNVGSREKYSQWVYERHNAKIKILENLHRRDDLKCTNAMWKKKENVWAENWQKLYLQIQREMRFIRYIALQLSDSYSFFCFVFFSFFY